MSKINSINKFKTEIFNNININNAVFSDITCTQINQTNFKKYLFYLIIRDNNTNKLYLIANDTIFDFIDNSCITYNAFFIFSINETSDITDFLNNNFLNFSYSKKEIFNNIKYDAMIFMDNKLVYGKNHNVYNYNKCTFDNRHGEKDNKQFIQNLSFDIQKIFSEANVYNSNNYLSDNLTVYINKNCEAAQFDNGYVELTDTDKINGFCFLLKQEDKKCVYDNSVNEKTKLYQETRIWYAVIYKNSSNTSAAISIKHPYTTTGVPCFNTCNISSFSDLASLKCYHPEFYNGHTRSCSYVNFDIFEQNIEKYFKKVVIRDECLELHLKGGIIRFHFHVDFDQDCQKELAKDVLEILAKKHLIEDSVLLEFKLKNI